MDARSPNINCIIWPQAYIKQARPDLYKGEPTGYPFNKMNKRCKIQPLHRETLAFPRYSVIATLDLATRLHRSGKSRRRFGSRRIYAVCTWQRYVNMTVANADDVVNTSEMKWTEHVLRADELVKYDRNPRRINTKSKEYKQISWQHHSFP